MHHAGDVSLPIMTTRQNERAQVSQTRHGSPSHDPLARLGRPALILHFQIESRWAWQVRIEGKRLPTFLDDAHRPVPGHFARQHANGHRWLHEVGVPQPELYMKLGRR